MTTHADYEPPRPRYGTETDDNADVSSRAKAIAYLNRHGNLGVPCSRYGHDTYDCSPVAYRVAYLVARETGEPITPDGLEHAMGLVVNDHDDPAHMVRQYGNYKYR